MEPKFPHEVLQPLYPTIQPLKLMVETCAAPQISDKSTFTVEASAGAPVRQAVMAFSQGMLYYMLVVVQ